MLSFDEIMFFQYMDEQEQEERKQQEEQENAEMGQTNDPPALNNT